MDVPIRQRSPEQIKEYNRQHKADQRKREREEKALEKQRAEERHSILIVTEDDLTARVQEMGFQPGSKGFDRALASLRKAHEEALLLHAEAEREHALNTAIEQIKRDAEDVGDEEKDRLRIEAAEAARYAVNFGVLSPEERSQIEARQEEFSRVYRIINALTSFVCRGEPMSITVDVAAEEVERFAMKYPPVPRLLDAHYYKNYGLYIDGIDPILLGEFRRYVARFRREQSEAANPVIRKPQPYLIRRDDGNETGTSTESAIRAHEENVALKTEARQIVTETATERFLREYRERMARLA